MEFKKKCLYIYRVKGVLSVVLKFQCPNCGKGDKSELIEVMAGRKYRMKCEDCQYIYTLMGDVEEEKSDKSGWG